MLTRLTATQITALRPAAIARDITDAAVAGLVLRIKTNGSKHWLFRFKLGGRGTRIALGSFPTIGLAEARALALQNRQLLERGIDPRNARRTRRRQPVAATRTHYEPSGDRALAISSITPEDYLQDLLSENRHSIRFLVYEYVNRFARLHRYDPGYVIRILEKDVLPEWQNRDARTITSREVVELLDKIVDRGSPVMANRTAAVLRQMFKFGVHRAIVDDSPVKLLFAPGGRERSRSRVLSPAELNSFLNHLPTAVLSKKHRHILVLLLLTLQRRNELGTAEWSEFDFEGRTWRIPDEHAKKRRGHVVPLTGWAVAELEELKRMANNSRYVLPSSLEGRASSPAAITRSVSRSLNRFQEIGIAPFTPHDLRRTGRTQLAWIGIPPHIAERVLNHSPTSIERTYDRYEYLEEKRQALEAWEHRLRQLQQTFVLPAGPAATRDITR